MKRTFSVLMIFFALACTVFFIGCQDVIFAKIMGEVALEDATISGRINSIVRYTMSGTEYVFIQNGRVYCKPRLFAVARRLGRKIGRTSETRIQLLR